MVQLKLAAIAAVLSVAAGCTTQAEHSEYFGKVVPPEGQHMRYISGPEPESLDPQVSSGQPEARLHIGLFDGLTEYHPETGQAIPALAERWEPNTDNSEFTFHLRDARWSNGDPITAHDFVYSLRRGLAPAFAARTAYLAYYIKGAQAYNEGKGKAEDVGVDGRRRSNAQVHARAAGAVFPGADGASVLPARPAESGRSAWPAVDAAAAHRRQRRVYAADLEAVQQARLRAKSAVLGCEERQARVDHVLSHGSRHDDDEPVQGWRG